MSCKAFLSDKQEASILKEPFVRKELDAGALYTQGLIPYKGDVLCNVGAGSFAIVFPAEYGKTYKMHFSEKKTVAPFEPPRK